jgi:hypothetical protein
MTKIPKRPEFKHLGGKPIGSMMLNYRPREDETMTVVIAGVPRGGTTMVAAVVDALGVYLGPEEDLRTYTFEDQTMNLPWLASQHECIEQRNVEFDVWGWKNPGATKSFGELVHALRNPRVIIVFRDLLSSIMGEMNADRVLENPEPRSLNLLIDDALERQERNLIFARRTRLPTLLVSYEKCIIDRNRFLDEIIEFLGLDPSPEERETAMNRIGTIGGYIVW